MGTGGFTAGAGAGTAGRAGRSGAGSGSGTGRTATDGRGTGSCVTSTAGASAPDRAGVLPIPPSRTVSAAKQHGAAASNAMTATAAKNGRSLIGADLLAGVTDLPSDRRPPVMARLVPVRHLVSL